ncbi:M1 family metallopeptidase [Nocardioides sp. W7]|uniref:M1 family metallopeptidase n=1 Tax=Nocardioides sp. W7 TaxID=2931390 RepID=UPI001FD08265|nr:M1 family metallopeptidase [Nocardioides sp. W7]
MKKTRALPVAAASTALLVAALVPPADAVRDRATPGADSAGDAYFPLDGNGGYDVEHYDLRLRYDPDADLLRGRAKLEAKATQRLSSFNLDLVGLTVREIRVDGERARWSRTDHELTVTPRHPLRDDRRFTVRVVYDGVPEMLEGAGFIATDDGFDIAGQPHVAASWYPVNDHPTDKASYTFRVTVPRGLEAVANGDLVAKSSRRGWSTWTWQARDPMASYLTTVDVGEFDLHAYRADGRRYLDAVDPDLYEPIAAPSTGTGFAVSQAASSSYKRLMHTLSVPAGGASAAFTLTRDTEADWDFVLVEVHTVGEDDWTTLPDLNGHTTQATGNSCLLWPDLHPFVAEHYQSIDQVAETCSPTGATGTWWAASGTGAGPEEWEVDLSPYAGSDVELSISYVSDDLVQQAGLFVDDIVVSTGEGSTSFESGPDGWTVPGPPAGSPGNENDWIVGTAADVPPSTGEIVDGSFARQPEIVGFLSGYFGPYPWRSVGGIVDDVDGLGFALETQTRPIYSKAFFTDPVSGDGVVVHELAHQWYGDSLAVERWREIWLNEGFATYAEWLWSEREGLGTTQETFDFFYDNEFIPPGDPWWDVVIGDPGPDQLFEFPVYFRGAMTLHVLRATIGDDDFFRLLRVWARSRAGDNVTTAQFIRLAERISGQQLDDLFETWLYTPGRPELAPSSGSSATERSARRATEPPASAEVTLGLARREGRWGR